jgi:plasmid maintenance system antidote protein VapI
MYNIRGPIHPGEILWKEFVEPLGIGSVFGAS